MPILDDLRQPAVHLMTLTGPGGVGKTRLAERIASDLRTPVGLEVKWVSLAPLETVDQVAQAIGQQFGLKGIRAESLPDRLASALLGRPALIVLDNFEHVLSAALLVAEVLDACPTLTVLATSRGPLNISWEHEVALELELEPVHERAHVLSNRESEVLRLLARGATNGEIAEQLFVSRRMIDTHVGAILHKLQAASRYEAVETARRHGIVDAEDAIS